MTYEQFWLGDPKLATYYRKAHEIKNREKNEFMWLQGLYMVDALNSTVGNLFVKNKADMHKYMAEPIPITEIEMQERKERELKRKEEESKAKFMALALSINANFGKGSSKKQ